MSASRGVYAASGGNLLEHRSKRTRTNKRANYGKRKILAVIIIASSLALVMFLDTQIRPVIETVAGYNARVEAVKAINDAFYSNIGEGALDFQYDDMVILAYDSAGKITSIETNVLYINKFKAAITEVIIESILELKQDKLEIPLGTFTGNQFLAGHGPLIPVEVLPVGYVTTQITSKFEQAGINQTRHEIMLNVEADISAIIPGYSVTVNCPSNFILAETIIVGSVPENYTNVITKDSELVRDINDYSN